MVIYAILCKVMFCLAHPILPNTALAIGAHVPLRAELLRGIPWS